MKTNTQQADTMLTAEQELAQAMQADIFQNIRDINNVLTTAGNVRACFHGHYENMETGEFGIADLICKILKEKGAIFAKGSEDTELRPIMAKVAMFADDIHEAVQQIFTAGSKRYPEESVAVYLSDFLIKQNRIAKFPLKGFEDSERNSVKNQAKRIAKGLNPIACRPRTKYYLIA